jgi:multimeric flavodoxin WrbA
MAYEIEEPVLFDFKFDVTAFCKNAIHKWLIWEWFAKKFDQDNGIIFNAVTLESPQEDTTVGDPVECKMTTLEPYRTDGVFELTFNFKITAMVQIVEPKEVELLQTLLINLNNIVVE